MKVISNTQFEVVSTSENHAGKLNQTSRIHQLFEAQVLRSPDCIAIELAGKRLSYQELNQHANQLAYHLQALGVQPDVLVGLCLERSIELIIAVIAILKAGGAYLPLDPSYPVERLNFMLENAQVSILLTQIHLCESLLLQATHCFYMDRDWQILTQYPTTNPDCLVTCDHLAYVIYTSGSTGKPKGVAMPHRPLENLITWQLQNSTVGAEAKTLQYTPISFDVSFQEIFSTLAAGGTLVLIANETRRDPVKLLQYLNKAEIERLFLPFVALRQLAEVVQIEGIVPTCLREVMTAGEQLRITPAIAHLFSQLPNCTLHNHYGPSETHVVTAFTLSGLPQDWPVLPPIGKPIANNNIYLLDSQLQSVPVGALGELYVGGVSLARGYLHRPELTAERFIANPFAADSDQRLYKTGDLAKYLPDGNIEYLGRIDQQVKIRGYRIEPGEVEATLEKHPQVRQAVVMAREDVPGNKLLVAYVVLNSVEVETSLRLFLQIQLPEYMVPSAFVLMDDLPLTPNGKVNRQALPAPNQLRPELQEEFIAPSTPIEKQLVEIWTQLLGLDQVGVHDNFFELGGNSLLLAQMLVQVQKTFLVKLSLQNIFMAPTVADLTRIIVVRAEDNASSSIHPVVNLEAEAVLDPTIHSQNLPLASISEPENVLLTGVTGFLGAYLLHELLSQTQANIYCLVRAKSNYEGHLRIQNNLKNYGLWEENQSDRIIPVIGDLARPFLGISQAEFQNLSAKIDAIYHNGALVNFLYPYSALKAANVLGTQEVLRLATQTKLKSVHFVSSIGVFSPSAYPDPVILEQEAEYTQGLYGYTQSKWVAEKLVNIAHQRGIPTTIYRPTWIEGHSETGICNQPGFLRCLIKGCIQLGLAPDGNMPVDIVPVDYISRAITHLSRQKYPNNRIFHISNPQSISWHQLVHWMQHFGYSIQLIPLEDWLSKVMFLVPNMPENALYPFLGFLSEKVSEQQKSAPEFYFQSQTLALDCQNTLNGLADTNIACPPVNDKLLKTYFSYFISHGFLEPPSP